MNRHQSKNTMKTTTKNTYNMHQHKSILSEQQTKRKKEKTHLSRKLISSIYTAECHTVAMNRTDAI